MKTTAAFATILLAAMAAGVRAEEAPAAESASKLLADGDRLFGQRKYDDARAAYEKAAAAAEAAKDSSTAAEALSQVARMHSLTGALDEGRKWLARAEAVADPAHPLGYTRYLGVRGIFEREGGDKAKALATFAAMYDYALAKDLPRRAIDAAHHAAIVAPPEEQIAWARKGIAAASAAKDEGWLAVLWNNLGATHEDARDFEAAAAAYEKAREYHYRTGGEIQKLAADWALGSTLLRCGKVDRAEEFVVAARKAALALYAKAPGGESREWFGFAEWSYGELLAARGKRAEALPHLTLGLFTVREAGMAEWWPERLAEMESRLDSLRKEAASGR